MKTKQGKLLLAWSSTKLRKKEWKHEKRISTNLIYNGIILDYTGIGCESEEIF